MRERERDLLYPFICFFFLYNLSNIFLEGLVPFVLFSVVLGLHCRLQASLAVVHGLSCPVVYGILVLQPGIEPMSPALEHVFLITGPSGKCHPFICWRTFGFFYILAIVNSVAINIGMLISF